MSASQQVVIDERPDGIELTIKVVPGSSRMQIAGAMDGVLRIAVTAPPEGGKANRQVVQLLATTFGVKRGAVEITSGHTHARKRIHIAALTPEQAHEYLASLS